MNIRICCIQLVVASCAVLTAAARAQHTGDVWVGATAAGRLTISPHGFVPEDNYHTLLPGSALLPGWTDSSPGFDRVTTDDPAGDVYRLPGSVDVWLEVVEVDPAFQVVIFGAPPRFLRLPGDSARLGGSGLHAHLPWHIYIDDPAYDSSQCVWHATFILRDRGASALEPSIPFTFNFTNVALVALEGDFDDDGDLDLEDLAALVTCLDGPGRVPQPNDPEITTCEVECLNAFDFDGDWDIDLEDFAAIQQAYVN